MSDEMQGQRCGRPQKWGASSGFLSLSSICFTFVFASSLSPLPSYISLFFSSLGEDNPLEAAEFIFPLFPQSKTASSHFQSHVSLRGGGWAWLGVRQPPQVPSCVIMCDLEVMGALKESGFQGLLELGGGRGWERGWVPGKGILSREPKCGFFQEIQMLSVIPSRMSILIICILITGLGLISIFSRLSTRRRNQRNRRGR